MDPEATLSELLDHPGEAFPKILTLVLLATVGVMLLHLVLALLGGRSSRPHRRLRIWEKLIYLGVLVCVAHLAVTSFFTVLRSGEIDVIQGWWLFAHMFGAGAGGTAAAVDAHLGRAQPVRPDDKR